MNCSIYRTRLNEGWSRYNMREGIKQNIQREHDAKLVAIANLDTGIDLKTKTSFLLQETAKDARSRAKVYLEQIVTDALQYVTGVAYTFEIELQELRGKPDATFYLVSTINGKPSRQDPKEECGGGLVDIIAATLRFAYLELFNDPAIKGSLGMDEPGKMISEAASVKFAEFVKQLCVSFGRQTIMVTHNDNLLAVADKAYVVVLHGDVSKVMAASQKTTIDEDSTL